MERNEDYSVPRKTSKQNNVLPFSGNETTMNLNPLILTNIQGSSYFKVSLFKLKTYHEVVDEIYYQVKHLEPWERGSRKTSGQTGMCGGVRGVGAGGIVSTAFCLLYKLYTLKLTRKQVNGLMTHSDSPFIRALGFMYVRYTQPPGDLFDWYEPYLQDEEEIDVKAGGGQTINIGQMLYQFLTKLDWFSTLFPRIPVPIQKQIESKLSNYAREYNITFAGATSAQGSGGAGGGGGGGGGVGAAGGFGGGNGTDKNRERLYPQREAERYGHREEHRPADRKFRSRSRSKEREVQRNSTKRDDRGDRGERYSRNNDRNERDKYRSYNDRNDRYNDRTDRDRVDRRHESKSSHSRESRDSRERDRHRSDRERDVRRYR